MENYVEIIMSERGKELAVVSLHKYRFIRKRKDGFIKWLCSNKMCYANILTNSDKTEVVSSCGEHNHEVNTVQKIERQILRENCKRRASETISTRPSKIIQTELLINRSTELVRKDISSVRKAMYMERRKNPSFTQTLVKPLDLSLSKDPKS